MTDIAAVEVLVPGIQGPQGIQGEQGPPGQGIQGEPGQDGAPGPNEITAETTTDLDGFLLAEAGNVTGMDVSLVARLDRDNVFDGVVTVNSDINCVTGNITGDGGGLSNLSAAAVTGTLSAATVPATSLTGTIAQARLPAVSTSTTTTLSSGFVKSNGTVISSAAIVAADVPALDTAKVATGVFAKARLPAATVYTDAANTYTADQTFSGGGVLDASGVTVLAENITGSDPTLSGGSSLTLTCGGGDVSISSSGGRVALGGGPVEASTSIYTSEYRFPDVLPMGTLSSPVQIGWERVFNRSGDSTGFRAIYEEHGGE